MSESIEARLKRLESAMGPATPDDGWKDIDPAIRTAVAAYALAAVAAKHSTAASAPSIESSEAKATLFDAATAMESALDSAGLLVPVLDDAGKAKLAEVVAGMTPKSAA